MSQSTQQQHEVQEDEEPSSMDNHTTDPWNTDHNFNTASSRISEGRQLSTLTRTEMGSSNGSSPRNTANNSPDHSNHSHNTNNNDGVDDDDDITEIAVDTDPDPDPEPDFFRTTTTDFNDLTSPTEQQADDRRRENLIADLERIQKTNFIHFTILFMIPTCMIILVIWTALSNNGGCDEEVVGCRREPRRFVHAFTSRCLCDAFQMQE